VLQCVAVCCSSLRCVAVCCSFLRCIAVWFSVMQVHESVARVWRACHSYVKQSQCVAVCCWRVAVCSHYQTVAGTLQACCVSCCSVLQHVAVLQCVAACRRCVTCRVLCTWHDSSRSGGSFTKCHDSFTKWHDVSYIAVDVC